MEVSIKNYGGLIKMEFTFYVQVLCFCIKMYYNLCHGMSKLDEILNEDQLALFLSIREVRLKKESS
jgi:hypothetical protein